MSMKYFKQSKHNNSYGVRYRFYIQDNCPISYKRKFNDNSVFWYCFGILDVDLRVLRNY